MYYPDKYNKASYAGSETNRVLDFPWDTKWDEFLDFGTNVEANLVPQCPTYTVPGNTTITHVAAGDVDGDGLVEVVGVGECTDEYGDVYFLILVFEFKETGLLMQCNGTLNLGEDEELTSLACADCDDYLKDEIIIAANFYNLTDYEWYSCIIILNVDSGGIHLQAYDEGANISLESLAIADVDGDGYTEIVISGHIWD